MTKYPNIAAAGIDPLAHYINNGAAEDRMPNLWFDSAFYLADNPDLARLALNPFLHFLCAGYRQGRRPNPECLKRKKRLILVILAGDSDLCDAARMARTAKAAAAPPAAILVFYCPLPAAML